MKKKILFVCSGNTCRSPMAQYLFEFEMSKKKNNNFIADSAGLNCFFESPASNNSIKAIKSENTNIENHISKQLSKKLIKNAFLVVCMTNNIKNAISIELPEYNNKIITLKSLEQSNDDIKDPYGGNYSKYLECKNEIHYYIKKLIDKLLNEK